MSDLSTTNSELKWFHAVPLELHGHRKKLNFFINALKSFRDQRGLARDEVSVIEVGCSNGRNISLPLAERGYQITGVDIHSPSIAWAESHSNFPNARFMCRDFNEFDSEEMFDAVVLSDILEHVHQPLEIVKLALKHLNPGGIVLVCIPNGYGPYENEQRLLRVTGINWIVEAARRGLKRFFRRGTGKQTEYNYDSGHVQFFRMRDLQALVDEAGLSIDVQANGALFGGNASYAIGILLPFIVKPSLWLADRLPSCVVSTWYFRLSRPEDAAGLPGAIK